MAFFGRSPHRVGSRSGRQPAGRRTAQSGKGDTVAELPVLMETYPGRSCSCCGRGYCRWAAFLNGLPYPKPEGQAMALCDDCARYAEDEGLATLRVAYGF